MSRSSRRNSNRLATSRGSGVAAWSATENAYLWRVSTVCEAAYPTAMSKNPESFAARKPFALVTTGFDQIQEHPAAVPIELDGKQRAVDGEVRRAACGTQAL